LASLSDIRLLSISFSLSSAPSFVQKIYSYPDNYRVWKALVAAQYNGIDIELPVFGQTKRQRSSKLPQQERSRMRVEQFPPSFFPLLSGGESGSNRMICC